MTKRKTWTFFFLLGHAHTHFPLVAGTQKKLLQHSQASGSPTSESQHGLGLLVLELPYKFPFTLTLMVLMKGAPIETRLHTNNVGLCYTSHRGYVTHSFSEVLELMHHVNWVKNSLHVFFSISIWVFGNHHALLTCLSHLVAYSIKAWNMHYFVSFFKQCGLGFDWVTLNSWLHVHLPYLAKWLLALKYL